MYAHMLEHMACYLAFAHVWDDLLIVCEIGYYDVPLFWMCNGVLWLTTTDYYLCAWMIDCVLECMGELCLIYSNHVTCILIFCYFCYWCLLWVFLCGVLMLLSFHCTRYKLWNSFFCQNWPQGDIVVTFGLDALCKTTCSVQYVLVKKGHMLDQMFHHVGNIWTL